MNVLVKKTIYVIISLHFIDICDWLVYFDSQPKEQGDYSPIARIDSTVD